MKRTIHFYEARNALEIVVKFLEQKGKDSSGIISEFEKCGFGLAYPKCPTELEDLDLSTRAYSAMKSYISGKIKQGFTDLDFLESFDFYALIKIRGIGKKTAHEILDAVRYARKIES